MTQAELTEMFMHHVPKDGQPELYQAIRAKAREFAALVEETCPASREKSLAITSIQQSMMWANAAIAIHG